MRFNEHSWFAPLGPSELFSLFLLFCNWDKNARRFSLKSMEGGGWCGGGVVVAYLGLCVVVAGL